MSERNEASLFIVPDKLDTPSLSRRTGNGEREDAPDFLEIIKFFDPENIFVSPFLETILLRARESLESGNMALSVVGEELNSLVHDLQKCEWGEIFWDEEFRLTKKILVLVTDPSLRKGYLYFQKQWNSYVRLRSRMRRRAASEISPQETISNLDNLNPEQKVAVTGALRSGLSLILGGPGTGKTTIVSSLLEEVFSRNFQARVILLAPTRRASARLKENLKMQWHHPSKKDLEVKLEEEFSPRTIEKFLHEWESNWEIPLWEEGELCPDFDIAVVDEISMVSPFLFAELLGILSTKTRIVLLGDPNQLPSVSEGFLLGYFLHNSANSSFNIFHLSRSMRVENFQLDRALKFLQAQFLTSSCAPGFSQLSFVQLLSISDFLEAEGKKFGDGVFFVELPSEDRENIRAILRVYLQKYLFSERKVQSSEAVRKIFDNFFQSQLLTPVQYGSMGRFEINNFCHEESVKIGFVQRRSRNFVGSEKIE